MTPAYPAITKANLVTLIAALQLSKTCSIIGTSNFMKPSHKDYFQYRVYFEGSEFDSLISTKAGQKPAGDRLQRNSTAILLPNIDFDQDEFEDGNNESETIWSDTALVFGKRLTSLLVELDAFSKAETAAIIAPDWVQRTAYRFGVEDERDAQVKSLENKIEEIQRGIALQQIKADEQTSLCALLFENGKPLESTVQQALSILGFDVSHIDNDETNLTLSS